MTELSPAAQAVLDATNKVYDQVGTVAEGTAAALRAVVMQSLPKVNNGIDRAPFSLILDTANELEAQ